MRISARHLFLVGSAGLLLALAGAALPGRSGPEGGACEGCHAMAPQHASWRRGNHAQKAACGDCHLPTGASLRRSHSMAADGLRHAARAALGATASAIRLRGPGAEVVQANCVRCHPRPQPGAPVLDAPRAPRPLPQPATAAHADPDRDCANCHRETSHARN